MGGKKKAKGGKKGKKKGADTDPDPAEKNFILQAEIESLSQRLIMEQEMADRSKASENEKRHREVQLDKLLDEENNRQRDIVSDMTRQYKSRFEELSEKEKHLKREIDANSDIIAKLMEDYEKLEQEKQSVEKNKQEDIARLKKQIDDMSNEFAQMLKSTLEKMQSRINEANKQWEEENDVNLLKHFESAQLK